MEKEYFNNDEFEQFLKENADQHRMYPSDKVWNKIYSNLHFRSRLFGFGFTFLMLSLGTVSIYLLNNDKNKIASISNYEFVMPDDIAFSFANNINLFTEITSVPRNANRISTASIKEIKPGIQVQTIKDVIVENAITIADDSNKESIVNQSSEQLTEENVYTEQNIDEALTIPETIAKINELPAAMPGAPYHTLNELTIGKKKNHSKLQLYFTPTISYRKLSENKSYIFNGSTSSTSLAYSNTNFLNVNDFVSHQPDIGIEFGLTNIIPISRKLNLRAGLQFNLNRYSINAFNIPGEIATFALNRGTRVDSLSMISSYRNQSNGYNPDKLENYYFQISAPIGVEYMIAKNENVKFGIAGTIQPTYLLQDRAYLLSVDYKNYNEVPWLVRRVNANTSLEIFVAYSTGHLNWQIGPQVRYQLLSSFVDKYPVKENLFNFGFKIAATLNK